MNVAVDVNVLVYASDLASPFQAVARVELARRVVGADRLYLFWPVISGYLRIVTHPSIVADPLPRAQAQANVARLLQRPNVRAPGEDEGFWRVFAATLDEGRARGKLVPDAHLVALMRQHGVRDVVTHDRDLRRFDGIRVHDPFG